MDPGRIMELLGLLLLIAVGHSVLNASSRVVRRAARSFLMWTGLLGVISVSFCMPKIVELLVRLGIILLAAYVFRSIVSAIIEYVRGPRLFEMPGRAVLAEATQILTDMPIDVCKRLVRRITKIHDGYVALLTLMETRRFSNSESEFASEWQHNCANTRNLLREMVFQNGRGREQVKPADMRFIAQALCLYGGAAVEKEIKRLQEPMRGRKWRSHLAKKLVKGSNIRTEAEKLGLGSSTETQDGAVIRLRQISLNVIIFPPLGFAKMGCLHRATTLAIIESALVIYALVALASSRNVWLVFLSVAVWLHVHALFALGDFAPVLGKGKDAC